MDLTDEEVREELRCMLMDVEGHSAVNAKPNGDVFEGNYNEELGAWAKEWVKTSATAKRRKELVDVLLIAGLGIDDDNKKIMEGHYFSFCRGSGRWVQDNTTKHCGRCGECRDWREWHCKKCNRCNYGVSIPCDGCGGVSDMYYFNKGMTRSLGTLNRC